MVRNPQQQAEDEDQDIEDRFIHKHELRCQKSGKCVLQL
jgi:hypothetical protein